MTRSETGSLHTHLKRAIVAHPECLLIVWVCSDRKLLSATNHDLQGLGGGLMTLIVTSFRVVKAGELTHVCTTIPFAVLLGRPLVENAPLQRFGDSANGVQRFGDRSSPFMPPPAKKPPGQSVKVPVWAILDTLLKAGTRTTIPCTPAPFSAAARVR